MSDDFYQQLFDRPCLSRAIPSNAVIADWALNVIHILYPEHAGLFASVNDLKHRALQLEQDLYDIIVSSSDFGTDRSKELSAAFFKQLPMLYKILNTDIQAIYEGDPASRSKVEVIRTYPGFYAICFYRIAHILQTFNMPFIPRILTEHAHSKTGIDIHPSAVIGEYFHIDHGTGIVIGETTIIGNYVKLYQGVTLGALSVHKSLAGTKRHPTVQDRVVIYSGATILGGETVIGHDSIIGGNVWLTQSVAPNSTVYHTPNINVRNNNENI